MYKVFGSHNMTLEYPNLCYNEVILNGPHCNSFCNDVLRDFFLAKMMIFILHCFGAH